MSKEHEMEEYFSRERDIDIDFVLSVVNTMDLSDSLVINLSEIVYVVGIVGITQDKETNNFIVYEIDEQKVCNIVISTTKERQACREALNCLGLHF